MEKKKSALLGFFFFRTDVFNPMNTASNYLRNQAEVTLRRISAQPVLFAERLERLRLHELELDSGTRSFSVQVWRNHAFESVIDLAQPYFAFGGLCPQFRLSAYDDALHFVDHRPSDIELLWLDIDRYLANTNFENWLEWLAVRLGVLRALTQAPIIVATWVRNEGQRVLFQPLIDKIPGVYWADLADACETAHVSLIDPRSASVAGTPIGKAAQPILARRLACHWLPATVLSPIKAVVLDLDNTLHSGVLGEDGLQGVELSPAHHELQTFIRSLGKRGIFIGLLSRNESCDVKALFMQRKDYPLRWEDFTATEISWKSKAEGIVRLAEAFRIAPDAVLFVDDNPGELAEVISRVRELHTIHASSDASLTRRSLEYYPGLWRWRLEADDSKRADDLRANAERAVLLAGSSDPSDYLRSLQVSLTYRYNPVDQLGRLADLCQKTNQFNLSLRRFREAELADRMKRPDAAVVSVALKDRLSDSGVVAVIVTEKSGACLFIEELCLSCRALGRHLEDTMILWAIRNLPMCESCSEVVFRVRSGPRNQPAIDWLKRLPVSPISESDLISLSTDYLDEFPPPDGITYTFG